MSTDDMPTRVLMGELRGAISQAQSDLDHLIHTARQALVTLENTKTLGVQGDANRLAGSARTAGLSLMKIAVVQGKLEGLALARSVLE